MSAISANSPSNYAIYKSANPYLFTEHLRSRSINVDQHSAAAKIAMSKAKNHPGQSDVNAKAQKYSAPKQTTAENFREKIRTYAPKEKDLALKVYTMPSHLVEERKPEAAMKVKTRRHSRHKSHSSSTATNNISHLATILEQSKALDYKELHDPSRRHVRSLLTPPSRVPEVKDGRKMLIGDSFRANSYVPPPNPRNEAAKSASKRNKRHGDKHPDSRLEYKPDSSRINWTSSKRDSGDKIISPGVNKILEKNFPKIDGSKKFYTSSDINEEKNKIFSQYYRPQADRRSESLDQKFAKLKHPELKREGSSIMDKIKEYRTKNLGNYNSLQGNYWERKYEASKPFPNMLDSDYLNKRDIAFKKGQDWDAKTKDSYRRMNRELKKAYQNNFSSLEDLNEVDSLKSKSHYSTGSSSYGYYKVIKEMKDKKESEETKTANASKSATSNSSRSRKLFPRKPENNPPISPSVISSYSKSDSEDEAKKGEEEIDFELEDSYEEYQRIMELFSLLNDNNERANNESEVYAGPLKSMHGLSIKDQTKPRPKFSNALTRCLFEHFCGFPVGESAMRSVEECANWYLEQIVHDLENYCNSKGRRVILGFDVEALLKKQRGDLKRDISEKIVGRQYSFV